MEKFLKVLMAALFLGSTTGLVFAQDTGGDKGAKVHKTHKAHKGGKKSKKGSVTTTTAPPK